MLYVLPDTNILIYSPDIVKRLVNQKYYVVIPVTVIDELDNFKLRKDLSHKAREIGRVIESILNQKSQYLILTNDHKDVPGLNLKKADDRILATALYLKHTGKNVTLLSNDRFIRLKAEGLHLKVVSSPEKLPLQQTTFISALSTPTPANSNTELIETPIKISSHNEAYLIITSPTHLFQNRKLKFTVEGFDDKYLNRIKFIKPGDRFVYYVAGDKLFAAITEITSKLYFDKNDLWPMEPELKLYNRFKMEPKIVLKPNQILSAYSLVPKLKFIVNKVKWGAYFQGSIKKIPYNDYLVIKQEMIKTIEKWK